jgi:hypothetical protein
MSYHGRSLDDLPLAAYTTGMVEGEPEPEAEAETTRPPMDARATALSIVEGSASTQPPTVAQEPPTRLQRTARQTGPEPAAQASAQSVPVAPQPSPAAQQPGARTTPRPGSPDRRLALPPGARDALRNPRVLAGGGLVVAILAIAAIFGGGVASRGSAPGPTASPAPSVAVRPPGAATITLSGAVSGAYTLTGSTGFGRPAGDHLASTWTDSLGSSLTLTGQASSGTRPTGPDLVLTWTVVVKGAPVTFTSDAGECVVGMAVKPSTVSGSIVCTKLKSDDGKLVLNVAGDYGT